MSLCESEWPGGVVAHLAPSIIKTAQVVREVSGAPLIPSPVEAAHVRFENGTSRHAVGGVGTKRKSDATDLYLMNNADAATLWLTAQTVPGVGGFGIYFDTIYGGKKRVLVHLDNRPDRLLWLCPSRNRATEKRSYIYFRAENPGPYLDLLSVELSKL